MPRQSFRERLFARVNINRDDPDACWMWTAGTDGRYGLIWRDGRKVKAHRAVYEIYRGPIPDGKQLDHVCHVQRCVNPEHLRSVTNKENSENRAGARRDNLSSGVRGVYWETRRGKWRVQVGHHGRLHFGGYFDDLDEAAEAARQLRLRLYTHSDADRTDGEAAA